ncbi:DUF1566 domain-containing protein [bacterium]|nr:DUF1566 domain-containing protein [bacterium]
MKKAMFLTIILALLIFAGCGSGNKEEKTADTGDTTADNGSSDAADTAAPEGEIGAPVDDTDTDTNDDPCKLDDSLLAANENGGAFFAFKGVGKINADMIDPEPADHTKVSFGFSDIYGKQFFQGEQNTFFIGSGEGITAQIAADAEKDFEWRMTTLVYLNFPIQYIDTMKANGVNMIDAAPTTQIYDIAFSEDFSSAKQCIIAASKYSDLPETDEKIPLGKTQVCYGKNETFTAGETLKLAMRAELTTDKKELLSIFDVETEDKLCACTDSFGEVIDCKTVKWSDDTYNACHTINDTTWSPLSSGTMNWEEASAYCENLSVCGYTDWRLPNIDELRKLVKNCPKMKAEGECMISENNLLSYMEADKAGAWEGICEGEWGNGCSDGACMCSNSGNHAPGYFSEFGDGNIELWSSSEVTDITNQVWILRFINGVDIIPENTDRTSSVRCVR